MKQGIVFKWCILAIATFLAATTAGGGVAAAEDAVFDDLQQLEKLRDLNEHNWELMLSGEWMVEFFAPWCPACKNLAPTWDRFASVANQYNVNVAKIDVTTSPSLSGRFFVTALPTIYHVLDGEFRQYRGARDFDSFVMFVQKKQWKSVEPLSKWKKPNTIHMTILSYFFKLSHMLKDFNSRLQLEYGLPTWGSYALFAIGTIFVGAALGLLLVCVVDFLYPQKKTHRQSFSESRRRVNNDGIEDIANDELEDDAEKNDEDEQENENGEEDENDEECDDDEDCEDEDSAKKNEESNDESNAEDNITDGTVSGSQSEGEETESNKQVDDNKEKKSDKTANPAVTTVPDAKSGNKDAEDSPLAAAATGGGAASGGDVRKRKPRKAD